MAITEFIPVGLKRAEVAGKIHSDTGADLSERVMVMCLKPLLFGIWVHDKDAVPSSILLDSNGRAKASVSGVAESCLEVGKGLFCFWKPQQTRISGLSLKQSIVELPRIFRQSRKSKFRFSYGEVKHLTAGYFYPRRIYVVVVEHEEYLNVFPMDLHMHHPESNDYSFSLQVTNLATTEIKKAKKVLVCELASESIKTAYMLGKNHGLTRLEQEELPFQFGKSYKYGLLLPGFAIGYKEVSIDQYVDLSSHTIFLGKVEHEKKVDSEEIQPYHVHRFCFPYQNQRGENIPKLGL